MAMLYRKIMRLSTLGDKSIGEVIHFYPVEVLSRFILSILLTVS